ncbi:hypothetical protein [Roseobacter sp. CCS2]|uniref:hypothetical protein n=1 Tax=Roseobacter sp. CCS2 TaxID=391593 RepID=UPI0000F3F7CF|nr:hypothetical protein [Roseobacter sp. CCS2]EBA10601.1 hypothetical protein RCCS2_03087 [Roseobacter sp. CCS2]
MLETDKLRLTLLIYTNTDTAGAARGLEVEPILMGMGHRCHIVTPGITPRGLNMAGSDVLLRLVN